MFTIETPATTTQLLNALARQGDEIADTFRDVPIEEYFEPQGEHWSPSEHLRHLVKSVRPVAGALGMPKVLLGLRFGLTRHSRTFEEIVALYREELAGGAGAGRFAPSRDRPAGDSDAARLRVLEHWRLAVENLVRAAGRWSDRWLDRCRLPHPLLGKLTVREMLFFTLYHNAHHAHRVIERRAELQVSGG